MIRKTKKPRDLMLHAAKSCLDRYDHYLTSSEWEEMNAMIRGRHHGAKFILSQTGSRSIWRLKMHFGEVVCVYQKSKNAAGVCTVLTEYMLTELLRQGEYHYALGAAAD